MPFSSPISVRIIARGCTQGRGLGTEELVRRIASSGLSQVVNHRRVILPILGAGGRAGLVRAVKFADGVISGN